MYAFYLAAYIHAHNEVSLSHKKGGNLTICNDLDGPGGNDIEWNKSEKGIYHMISLTCAIKKKKKIPELIDKQNSLVVARGRGWEVDGGLPWMEV